MRRFIFLLLIIPLGCTTTSKKTSHLDPLSEIWMQKYKQALSEQSTNSTKSCETFTLLSAEKEFRLNELALIRAHLICPASDKLTLVPENILKEKPFLEKLELERRLKSAQRTGDSLAIAKALLAQSKYLGKSKEKLDTLQLALSHAKKTEQLDLISEIQNRIYKIAPQDNPSPKEKDFFSVAQAYFYQRNFIKGREFLNKIILNETSAKEDQYFARKLLRNSFKVEQKKEEYINQAIQFSHWLEQSKESPQRIYESLLTLARAQWTLGQLTAAQQSLRRTESLLKNQMPMDEVYFIRGLMSDESKDFQKALDSYSLAEANSNPKHAIYDRILFSKAWVLRKLGRFQEAAHELTPLIKKTNGTADVLKYKFWYTRSLAQQATALSDLSKTEPSTEAQLKELNAEIKSNYEALLVEDPLGYYGALAAKELKVPLTSLPSEQTVDVAISNSLKITIAKQYWLKDLAYVGENQILETLAGSALEELKANTISDKDTWLFVLIHYAQAGLYQPLFAQLNVLPAETRVELLKQNPGLLFPTKYLEQIKSAAKKFGVEPELVLSIIRQESAFNPKARSPADAFGLMQLLPSVAREHSRVAEVHLDHHEDLYNPEINIPLGTTLLARLLRKYSGQFILTAAAYNANEKAIINWLNTRLREDPLEFIEDIPYEETRIYVKLVLRNYIFYSRMLNPEKMTFFPNRCLQNLENFKTTENQEIVSN